MSPALSTVKGQLRLEMIDFMFLLGRQISRCLPFPSNQKKIELCSMLFRLQNLGHKTQQGVNPVQLRINNLWKLQWRLSGFQKQQANYQDQQRLLDRIQSKTTRVHSNREGRWMSFLWSLAAPFVIFINEIKFVEERNASSSWALGFGLQMAFIYALRSAYSKVV